MPPDRRRTCVPKCTENGSERLYRGFAWPKIHYQGSSKHFSCGFMTQFSEVRQEVYSDAACPDDAHRREGLYACLGAIWGPGSSPRLGLGKVRGLEGSCLKATREERPRSASAHGRVWIWVRRVLLALVGLIVVLLLLGLLYQFLATRIAYRNYPAPGEMVSVSGHDMHLYCTGKAGGGPTVVMDSGLGGGVLDWQTVQPKAG